MVQVRQENQTQGAAMPWATGTPTPGATPESGERRVDAPPPPTPEQLRIQRYQAYWHTLATFIHASELCRAVGKRVLAEIYQQAVLGALMLALILLFTAHSRDACVGGDGNNGTAYLVYANTQHARTSLSRPNLSQNTLSVSVKGAGVRVWVCLA